MLKQILAKKVKEVAELKKRETFDSLLKIIDDTNTRNFAEAISRPGKVNIIAEIKKASPSRGVLVPDLDPVRIAAEYSSLGAAALSVLTDEAFFQGHKDYIPLIKRVAPLPILRKDFIIDELQIYESRAIGADAILLIVAILSSAQLQAFLETTHKLNMSALVEVHNETELQKVLATDAAMIGINNRDLEDFSVDLGTTARLLPKIPAGKIIVSESGIQKKKDIPPGVNAVLIGEGLIKDRSLFQ
jgi:indole-3-glycerol phosphate synthase